MKLEEFDLEYQPRPSIKAKGLAYFLVECTIPNEDPAELSKIKTTEWLWILHVDESSNLGGSRVGLILTSPDGVIIEYALRFKFSTLNKKAKYEVLITRLKLSKEHGSSS